MKKLMLTGIAAVAALLTGCDPEEAKLTDTLGEAAWKNSEWIAVPSQKTVQYDGNAHKTARAADGTSWFGAKCINLNGVREAKWMVTALGTFDAYVNGKRVGEEILKPGFTRGATTRVSYTYDITALINVSAGSANWFTAEVSAGWWRDKIVNFFGKKSAFRGVVEFTYDDGSKRYFGTDTKVWKCGMAGPVTHAAIFDGEEYDARIAAPYHGEGLEETPEVNTEFAGAIVANEGAEVYWRKDLAMSPVEAYTWKKAEGATADAFGKIVKAKTFTDGETMVLEAGEKLVLDFAQNAAAVPFFQFRAKAGTVLTALPGEMLNDGNGAKNRGNDGPEGSLYRQNLRCPDVGMRAVYTFAGKDIETYIPHLTFFGYRYISIEATDTVEIDMVRSVPVTSITQEMELGSIKTGSKDVNRLIENVYWGQLSNYLSVPTDCPQRNERLGWTADTQVFTEAGAFNADTRRFFRKWMRDMRDSQDSRGGFPGVAPSAQYGNNPMRIGWADAGIITPYMVWKQFGDTTIVKDNWEAMAKYVGRVAETKYEHNAVKEECGNYQWADWLSFEKLESAGGAGKPQNSAFGPGPNGKGRVPKADALLYWDYLGGSYWTLDAQYMAQMAEAIGKTADAAKYRAMEEEAREYMKKKFFATPDGMVIETFRDMQTPALFALKLGFVEGKAKEATIAALRKNVASNNGCLQTGFLGTSILMDTLTENGMADLAYSLLLNHNFPGWLYSVDQGATTIWERWNSYTKAKGFGPVGMNSFNHYAYGTVLAWIYKTAAGIAADPKAPGYRNIIMRPIPDKRLGSVNAEYKTPSGGIVASEWHYDANGKWVWNFTVPAGSTASVTLPGETAVNTYEAGTYTVTR